MLEQLTNSNVPVKIHVFNCSANIKTKDCARSKEPINYASHVVYIHPIQYSGHDPTKLFRTVKSVNHLNLHGFIARIYVKKKLSGLAASFVN